MMVLAVIICLLIWVIVGMIVAESVRIWFGLWWLQMSPSVVLLWPVVLVAALFGRNHES